MKLPRTVLLTLLCLTLFATSAAAERGWVLWATHFSMGGGAPASSPDEPTGRLTKDGCEYAEAWYREREKESREKTPTVRTFFKCLPDTVDPRGAKGSGR